MDGSAGDKAGEGAPGLWAARISLLMASAALSMLLLLGLGALPGLLLGAAAWALASRTLSGPASSDGKPRSTAKAAVWLAAPAVLIHGLMLMLYISELIQR